MVAGKRVCSLLSDAPKQTARRSGSELGRMQASLGEMGQYQTSELNVAVSRPDGFGSAAASSSVILGHHVAIPGDVVIPLSSDGPVPVAVSVAVRVAVKMTRQRAY